MAGEPIAADDTYGTLAPRLQGLGGDLLVRMLDEQPEPVQQPDEGVTYAEKIGPADRTLDPQAPAVVNDRVVRALTPHIGARVALPGDGAFLGVLRAALRDTDAAGGCAPRTAACCSAASSCSRSSPPAGAPMDAAAYLRGHGLPHADVAPWRSCCPWRGNFAKHAPAQARGSRDAPGDARAARRVHRRAARLRARGRTPTARCITRSRASTGASARSRCSSPTAPSSAS